MNIYHEETMELMETYGPTALPSAWGTVAICSDTDIKEDTK